MAGLGQVGEFVRRERIFGEIPIGRQGSVHREGLLGGLLAAQDLEGMMYAALGQIADLDCIIRHSGA